MALLRGLRTLLVTVVLVAGQAVSATDEYELKAVFLLNFSRFVEWPASAFGAPDAPFVLCVLGHDPFGVALDAAVEGETIGEHTMTVRRVGGAAEASGCHILFVHRTERMRLGQALAVLKNASTLTVSDLDRNAPRGEVIRFVMDKDRIRLRIDVEAARAAGLQVSSKLLRAAEVVGMSRG
jgi:hypothetical protein